MNKFKLDDHFELANLIEKLFGRRSVSLVYRWHAGGFQIELEGEIIEHDLEEILELIKRYDISGSKVPYNSYEELIKVIEDEMI